MLVVLRVVFFRTAGGNEPVLDWLRGMSADDRRIVGEDLRTVQLGWPLGMALCRPLGDGLFEVRSTLEGNRVIRVVFFQYEDCLVIVEGFVKKSRSTPDDVLKLARARMSEHRRNAPGRKK